MSIIPLKLNVKTENLVGWMFFIVLLCIHVKTCSQYQNEISDIKKAHETYRDSAEITINKNKEQVATILATNTSLENLIMLDKQRYDELKSMYKDLSKIVADVKATIIFDTVDKEVPVYITEKGEQKFEVNDSCLSFSALIDTNKRVAQTNYFIRPIDIQLTTRYEKKGMFKDKELVVDLTTKSPCGTGIPIKPIYNLADKPRPWYYHWSVPLLTGLVIGTYTTVQLSK